jgi:hypothetical protein
VNIRLLTTEAMKNPLEIWAQPLTTHGLTIGYEVHPRIQGCSEKENVRTFLNEDLLKEFDDKVLKATITLLKPVDYYLPVTPAVVRSDTLMKAKTANKQIHVMIYEYVPDLLDLINKCAIRQVHVLLHYHLLDQLSVFDLQKLSLQAIIIDEGLEKEKRTHLLEIASKMNWAIYSNYQFPDYENCIIREPRLLKEW